MCHGLLNHTFHIISPYIACKILTWRKKLHLHYASSTGRIPSEYKLTVCYITFPVSLKVRDRGEFPGYIGDSIEGYLEESHKFTVLDVIGCFMTSQRYPPPALLHTITHNLLLVSSLENTLHSFLYYEY